MLLKKQKTCMVFITFLLMISSTSQIVYSKVDNDKTKKDKKVKKEEFDILKPGTMLNKTYKIIEDDNYYNIAKKYKLDYKKLMEINNTEKPYPFIGHKIILTKETEPGNKYHGIIINIPEQKLYFFYKGNLSKIYKVSVGRPEDQWQTPIGDFKVLFKDKAPVWNVPLSIQKDMIARGLPVIKSIPSGKSNPLGNWFMGINKKGLGIHSTNAPSSVGYSVTHGCIRINPQSAEVLFNLVEINMPVKIIYQPIKLDINNKKEVYLEVYKNIYDEKLNTILIVKNLLKKYNINEKDIDWKKVQEVSIDKKGIPSLISKS